MQMIHMTQEKENEVIVGVYTVNNEDQISDNFRQCINPRSHEKNQSQGSKSHHL